MNSRLVFAVLATALLVTSGSALIGYTLGSTAQWLALPGFVAIGLLVGFLAARSS